MSEPQSASPAAASSAAAAPADLPTRLGALRAEIDRIDDHIHDLLMRRAAVVEQVAGLRRAGRIPFRPGREAAIIRRLLARHTGRLPRRFIFRLWREMYAANISIETPFRIVAWDPGPDAAMVQLAREQFGALTPLQVAGSAAEALTQVRSGSATAAVLPLPAAHDAAGWWIALLDRAGARLHVAARLPFWAARPEGAVTAPALVVAAAAPDPSGNDRSLLALPASGDTDAATLARSWAAAGLHGAVLLFRDTRAGWMLVDVAGHLTDADPGLAALPGAAVLGGYAVPVESAAP